MNLYLLINCQPIQKKQTKMSFITLINPKSISSETSQKKDNYYIVSNFKSSSKTKTLYKETEISTDEALYKIKYEGVECRCFDKIILKRRSIFVQEKEEFYVGSFFLFAFIAGAFVLTSEQK